MLATVLSLLGTEIHGQEQETPSSASIAAQADSSAGTILWRLDCGTMEVEDAFYFSDAYHYDAQSKQLSNGCYLLRHGERLLLWDAGIAKEKLGNRTAIDGWTIALEKSITEQLTVLGMDAKQVTDVGISHYHGDHIGQLGDYQHATLLLSNADKQALEKQPQSSAARRLQHWLSGQGEMVTFERDHDVFGDGVATILALPGHTPGHSGLMVRLPETGPVLLAGDLYHFREEMKSKVVSQWNPSRADTIASFDRVDAIIRTLAPVVIVQHDPEDIHRLPLFPEGAK